MDKVVAYSISAFITGFGLLILIAGQGSAASVLWDCAAIVPLAVGLLSAFGPT